MPVPFPQKPTISFTSADAHWLHLALETTMGILSEGLVANGEKPSTDAAYKAYSRLEKQCREFWLANDDGQDD